MRPQSILDRPLRLSAYGLLINRLDTLLPIILLGNLIGPVLRAQSDTDAQPDVHAPIGVEVAILNHLQDGQELEMPIRKLIGFDEKLFTAVWTIQEGAWRPTTKGTGNPLSDCASRKSQTI